jgi:hypothetical protein
LVHLKRTFLASASPMNDKHRTSVMDNYISGAKTQTE